MRLPLSTSSASSSTNMKGSIGLGRPPLNDTPTSRKRRAAAAAAQQHQQQQAVLSADSSLASSSICASEQSSAEIRPAVTFEPGANTNMFDEELDNFVQYMDADGDMGDSSSQDFEAAHQVLSFDNNDSLDEEETERVGGVRGFFFGRKRRRKKQRQQLNSPPKLRNSSTQVQSSSAVATLPVPKAPNTTTSVPLHHRNQHSSSRPLALSLLHTAPSTSTSIPHVIPPSPRDELVPTHHHHHQQQQQQLVELQQPESTSIANFQSFDLDIDTIPVSPRMAPISPFTQDAALQAIDDDNNNNYNASDRNMYEDEDIYFYQDEEPMRPMMLTRNPSWKSATSMVDSVQAEQASSTIMVPHNSSGSVEIVEHRGGTGNHHHTTNANANSTNTNMTLALLQRQGSWTRRLNRRDIYQRHYVPSKQELEEIKELEGYLGVFSSTTRQRFAGLWQQLVPPLADSSISKRSRRNLLERQSSTSSVSSLSSYTQQQQLQQLQLKSTHGNQAFYSIVIKRGPIQFEQYQDYQCEWILLTRGFVVARPNFQFIPRFQAGDLWTSVVQVQPTNPLSITLSCVSRNTALSSSNHLTLTQLKHQQQYGCYTYEVSCETPQEQASWLEAVRKLVIQAHDSAGTNEKEMGGMGWQYRVVYNPFFSEAVTGHPIQKDKILAGSTGHVDLNDLDSYNSYAPLHYATRANHVRVMRFLLEAGADVHVGDGYGRTPMYYAELHQLPESTMQLLESYGAHRAKKPMGVDRSGRKERSCQRKLMIIAMVLLLLACVASAVLWKLGMLEQFGIGGDDITNQQSGPGFTDYGTITFGSFAPSAAIDDYLTEEPVPELTNRGPDTVSPYPTSIPTATYTKTLMPTSVPSTAPPSVIVRQSPPSTDAPSTLEPTPSPGTVGPTTAPTRSVFETELFKLLESASTDYGAALRRFNSPQQRAFLWLLKDANLGNYSNDRKLQRYALATLYYSTNGDEWSENLYWLSEEDECLWFTKQSFAGYPVCEISQGSDRRKALINLDLSFNNLKGTIPPEVGLLSGLLRVDLDGGPSGFLTGPLPSELGRLNRLESFSARGNQLSGSIPPELGNWAQIRGIDLSFNNLLGELPTSFGSMKWLTELTLEMNELSGPLPPMAIGQLTNLFKMGLGGNQFTGAIPPEIGLLTKLRYLYLELNEFTYLPTEIGNLVDLNVFSIFENSLQGSIPSEFGRLTKLGTLLLRSNSLTSTIPSEMGLMVSLLGALDLSFNDLRGPVPSDLRSLTSLRALYLQSNNLSGALPSDLARLSHLNTLRVEKNNLVGIVPMDICDIFSNTYPNFYADCQAEVDCSCCTYCCLDGQGCTCQYAGTANAFLC